ncbi:MAG TPA: hypothetical protein VGM91_13185 [Conexibacter sp.]
MTAAPAFAGGVVSIVSDTPAPPAVPPTACMPGTPGPSSGTTTPDGSTSPTSPTAGTGTTVPGATTTNPDGTTTTPLAGTPTTCTSPDGSTTTVDPATGTVTTTAADGSVTTTLPDGTTTTAPGGGAVLPPRATLFYRGDSVEPVNVTVSESGDAITLKEQGSRISTSDPACTVSRDGYSARCEAPSVTRLSVSTGDLGGDVRIKADLPAQLQGGAGDDVLIGGPGDDAIDGGAGMDVIGGGGGADQLHGGSGVDLVSYFDRIGSGGTLLARTTGVTLRPGARGGSGGRGEGDTVFSDVEQLEGGNGADRFNLRDGHAQSVACDGGRDTVTADPLDDPSIDCETTTVAAAPRGSMTTPTLVFPFPGREDNNRSTVHVQPVLRLQGNAVAVRVRCQIAVGILTQSGAGCSGTLRMARGGTLMATRRFVAARGASIVWRVPLTSSRALARRAGGLPVTVSALPLRGEGVRRDLSFTVRG